MYDCKIVTDSVALNGCRLTTFEVTYPLIIHAEIMTHRVFSRNVASNRAIPVKRLIASVEDDPFIPARFPKNQAGMQNNEWLSDREEEQARMKWLEARNYAVDSAKQLMALNVHKQIANRLLAPFLWTTAVITATDWSNFFALRCHPAAQPEIQWLAYLMRAAYENSMPKRIPDGYWHLPYVTEEVEIPVIERLLAPYKSKPVTYGEIPVADLQKELTEEMQKISIGRCARVSYLNHGENNTPDKDIELCERLIASRHMSPTEHVATPIEDGAVYSGNFRGWKQYRKFIDGESGE